MDWNLLLQVWAMYHSNPLFWIISIPFVLWWWNFLKRQVTNAGLPRLVSNLRDYTKRKVLNRHIEYRQTVMPSPRSGTPFSFRSEMGTWFVFSLCIAVLFMFASTFPRFSWQWWRGVATLFLFASALGLPIYASVVSTYFSIARVINVAKKELENNKLFSNEGESTFLNAFLDISDDLRMGLDPRVLILTRNYASVSNYTLLTTFERLKLIKPDSKIKSMQLASRYYLTRSGATLATRLKRINKEDK